MLTLFYFSFTPMVPPVLSKPSISIIDYFIISLLYSFRLSLSLPHTASFPRPLAVLYWGPVYGHAGSGHTGSHQQVRLFSCSPILLLSYFPSLQFSCSLALLLSCSPVILLSCSLVPLFSCSCFHAFMFSCSLASVFTSASPPAPSSSGSRTGCCCSSLPSPWCSPSTCSPSSPPSRTSSCSRSRPSCLPLNYR